MKMSMQLLEALTILTAGNSGEINYHANDESFAIFQEARRTVRETATQLVDARLLGGKISTSWGEAELRAYHKDRTWPFT